MEFNPLTCQIFSITQESPLLDIQNQSSQPFDIYSQTQPTQHRDSEATIQTRQQNSSNFYNFNTGDFQDEPKPLLIDEMDFENFKAENQFQEVLKTNQKICHEEISSSQTTQKNSKQRIHLKGKRRKKGFKNKLQKELNGYWTKNLLPFAKNPHFIAIIKFFGEQFIQNNPILREIRKKSGITMEDYEKMYTIPQLKVVWQFFFNSHYLYRELMISRTEGKYRKVYVRFLYKFQEAYQKGQFIGISRKVDEQN